MSNDENMCEAFVVILDSIHMLFPTLESFPNWNRVDIIVLSK